MRRRGRPRPGRSARRWRRRTPRNKARPKSPGQAWIAGWCERIDPSRRDRSRGWLADWAAASVFVLDQPDEDLFEAALPGADIGDGQTGCLDIGHERTDAGALRPPVIAVDEPAPVGRQGQRMRREGFGNGSERRLQHDLE